MIPSILAQDVAKLLRAFEWVVVEVMLSTVGGSGEARALPGGDVILPLSVLMA